MDKNYKLKKLKRHGDTDKNPIDKPEVYFSPKAGFWIVFLAAISVVTVSAFDYLNFHNLFLKEGIYDP